MSRKLAISLGLCLVAAAASAQLRDRMVVSTDWLSHNMNTVTIVEIGDSATYGTGHIPGARLIAFNDLVTKRGEITNELPPVEQLEAAFTQAGLGDRGPVVLYSRDPLYATRAWFTLDYLGQSDRAAILDGGFNAWKMDGRVLTTAVEKYEPAPFHAKTNPAGVTTFNSVKQLLAARTQFGPQLVLIDARTPENFDQGSIPGAVSVPIAMNYIGGLPILKSEALLRDIYAKAGVTKTSTNVVFCRTGMQASLTYFVLKHLGYDARLYDGSFDEWTKTGGETTAPAVPAN